MGNLCLAIEKNDLLEETNPLLLANNRNKKTKTRDKTKNKTTLKQITVEKIGDCFLCDHNNVLGFETKSVIEDYKIFICNKCRNLV